MMIRREYHYIGPQDILKNLPENSGRVRVQSPADIIDWITKTHQAREYNNLVAATYVIDTSRQLWINDRRSEHVLCAAGENVLAAGEMAFELDKGTVEVVEVTNQSTGYCPEPASWWAVEQALNAAGVTHPKDFTMKFIFRHCEQCGTKNIVKDEWYECGVCQASLSREWNFDRMDDASA